ncbi:MULTISPECIES: DUF1294 domain-containing protein [unclassified Pseudoalteromonas]|uniref:DUF1294 domain-containing protein n=1 Tax=unclassified Pseudoalteromonas TaxID=194690 RepID=UPI00073155B9|nr:MULTISPECIES: DUF1294 domain-containing protein [unclassified Pseudoalteromonas]KTD96483.1 hypothetical protein ATS71_16245 [Pseudoalteromonas sp. H71]TMN79497.1 DUF1294 domain-containing protein [Pseudoalteromonas sp. S410]TMN90693.1 DUF1294 domain-containing protein [Pseudoalteromonas sp. S408]TMN95182.1 DUF1294 domain-containing protein [Pseudoalteromonas sp. S407]TMN98315.1 DUF1294 domain-containing protein [Pseudoalteromonas sp. S409]
MIKKTLIILSLFFIFILWVAHFKWGITIFAPTYITVISAITFIMYAWDKQKAKQSVNKKVSRTSERTLHLLALCGGWPGALIAQQLLRHKSQKKRFITVLWVCILLNIVLYFFALEFLGYLEMAKLSL